MKFLLIVLLLGLVSCLRGAKDNSANDKRTEEIRCLCMPETQLTINSFQDFPAKMKVLLNDQRIVDECDDDFQSDFNGKISRNEKAGTIKALISGKLQETVKLVIIDRGMDCKNDGFHFDEMVTPDNIILRNDPKLPELHNAIIEI